ncbi:DUF4255 domain-containing protein [Pseudoflavonifractor phocaeensis]|uniref:DUF4255 domain-containing protein n=1 Tax=Pseudoflavonifractor phocaeensis TaxID=1870988 RepID=UPI001956A303|nr:DUF4255 domain-containing protein [Pseudoflavonifractor phocaeensis]MBM6924799.1 DUF4255 domain-containing protein [Pseudoflavonifractor phocaeensis]
MADYPIISDVSTYMVQLLRGKMCPEPIPSPNNISVCSPAEQDADYILGIYLYDIREEGEVSVPSMLGTGRTRLQRPPRPYSLYYMLFINGSSQMGLKAADVQKILGRAAQIVTDGNVVNPRQLQTWLENEEPPIIFTPAKLSLEDKVRVWSAINKPYQVSLFYKASPVFVSSEIIVDSPRVTEAQFTVAMRGIPREEG